MQIVRSRPFIAALAGLLILAALGLLYYLLVYKDGEPGSVAVSTYVCDDESFYLVSVHDESIVVAGAQYELVSQDGGMRYEGTGPMAFVVNDAVLTVIHKETGEEMASCNREPVESTPIIEVRNI